MQSETVSPLAVGGLATLTVILVAACGWLTLRSRSRSYFLRPTWISTTFPGAYLLKGLTIAIALDAIATAWGSSWGATSALVSFFALCWVVIWVAQKKVPLSIKFTDSLRGIIEGLIGFIASCVTIQEFFFAKSGCALSVEAPTMVIFGLTAAACTVAVASSAFSPVAAGISQRSWVVRPISSGLTVFAALEIALFFLSPFGLGFFATGPTGWFVSSAGLFVLIVGCFFAPKVVVPAAGFILAVNAVAVAAIVGSVCDVANPERLGAVFLYFAVYGAIWLLGKKVFFEAILKVRDRSGSKR